MEQIRNVVVFGDSLSDIGKKVQTATGKLARNIGEMTVNASGRFSDCRNWTDFMYEEAAGIKLVTGDPKSSKAASGLHQRLTKNSKWLNPSIGPGKTFLYANYAEGGACGGIPAAKTLRLALGQFKDQVALFRTDWQGLQAPINERLTLFLVWFGANDLYTAGCKPGDMAGVAEKVANKRRHEISAIVGAVNARFIFMNLARPEASVRYQDALREQLGTKKDRIKKFLGGGIEKELDDFRRGADLFNQNLYHHAGQNGDGYVDVASLVAPDTINAMLQALHLLGGADEETKLSRTAKLKRLVMGPELQHTPTDVYDNPKLAKLLTGDRHVTTSDKAHPTDRVYKQIYLRIRETIVQRQYAFGLI